MWQDMLTQIATYTWLASAVLLAWLTRGTPTSCHIPGLFVLAVGLATIGLWLILVDILYVHGALTLHTYSDSRRLIGRWGVTAALCVALWELIYGRWNGHISHDGQEEAEGDR